MQVNKFKDAPPNETINKIRNILFKLNILVTENWNKPDIDNAYSVRINILGTNIGTNGKGTSETYALASAYAEFMERLANGILFSNWTNVGNDIFTSFSDEKYINIKEYYNDNLIVDNIIKNLSSKEVNSVELLKKNKNEKMSRINMIANVCTLSDNKILSLFFENINSKLRLPIPYKILRNVYGSNGMAAGNTFEEAMVQGISEIFERFCLKQICINKAVPPDIPRDFIKKHFPDIFNYINQIESKGNYFVRVRDGSLGLGLPVVCTTLFNKDNQTSLTIIGSHPSIEIALERTFTEMFQGRSIGQNWNPLFKQKNMEKYNLIGLFRNSSGYYPDEFYSYSPTYELNYNVLTQKFNSNTDMLDFYKFICKKNNFEIFVRKMKQFGFIAVHIIIPGVSEICDYDNISYNIDLMTKKASTILKNTKSFSKNDILEVLEFLDFSRKLSLVEIKISDNYCLTKDSKKNFNLYILMISLYFYLEEINRCVEFIKSVLQENFQKKQVQILNCILSAVEIINRNNEYKNKITKIKEILINFFDYEIVKKALNVLKGEAHIDEFSQQVNNDFKEINQTIINIKKFMKNSSQ